MSDQEYKHSDSDEGERNAGDKPSGTFKFAKKEKQDRDDGKNDKFRYQEQQKPQSSQGQRSAPNLLGGFRPFSAKVFKPNVVTPNQFKKPSDRPPILSLDQDNKNNPESYSKIPLIHNARKAATPGADHARTRPKNMLYDKEKLYEETLQLKNHINYLEEENMRHRTKISNLEKEASKFERMMVQKTNQFDAFKEPPPGTKSTEAYLTVSLKQQVKDLRNQLKQREQELDAVRKSVKFTKIQELEVQVKTFSDETIRLKNFIDFTLRERLNAEGVGNNEMKKIQDSYFNQGNQIMTLKRDNEEMAAAIKILEEQNFEYEKKFAEMDKKLKRESAAFKKTIQDKDREVTRLKNELFGGSGAQGAGLGNLGQKRPLTGQAPQNQNDLIRQELDRKERDNIQLVNQLADKEKTIAQLSKDIKDMRLDFSGKLASLENEKQNMLKELEKQKPQSSGLTGIKFEHSDTLQVPKKEDSRFKPQQRSTLGVDKITIEEPKTKRRLNKVHKNDVEWIAKELNFKLRSKRISNAHVERHIFDDRSHRSGTIAIRDIVSALRQEPFDIRDNAAAVLIARYLVEDNAEDYVFYDENAKNEVNVVKSVLRQLLGNIRILSPEEDQNTFNEISDKLKQNKDSIYGTLKARTRSEYFTQLEFTDVCRTVDVKFSEEQVEYIIAKVFAESEGLNKLQIAKIFEIFVDKAAQFLQKARDDYGIQGDNQNSSYSSGTDQFNDDDDDDQDLTPMKKLDYGDQGEPGPSADDPEAENDTLEREDRSGEEYEDSEDNKHEEPKAAERSNSQKKSAFKLSEGQRVPSQEDQKSKSDKGDQPLIEEHDEVEKPE